jgi:hypothetical protein
MQLDANLKLVDIDEDHVKGVAFNLVLLIWRYRTQLEAHRASRGLVTQMAAQQPTPIGVMQVVETSAVPPDSETRKDFGAMLRLPGIGHFCVTHEGSGFKAASVRAIVSGVHALSRPAFPHAVHDTIANAAQWAAAQNQSLGAPSNAAAIEQALQTLRRLHVERYPPKR